jgi:SAM-dependent methyltransferase
MCNQGCCGQINPTNSARSFKQPAPILRKLKVLGLLNNTGASVIEYGSGNLRNARFLLRAGHPVAVVEIKTTVDRYKRQYAAFAARGGVCAVWGDREGRTKPANKYDCALMTFVLETICDPSVRIELLRHCRSRLKRGGKLILSVRGHKDVLTAFGKGAACNDGYTTPGKTFIRGFNLAELVSLLAAGGFNRVTPLHKAETLAPELVHVIAQ